MLLTGDLHFLGLLASPEYEPRSFEDAINNIGLLLHAVIGHLAFAHDGERAVADALVECQLSGDQVLEVAPEGVLIAFCQMDASRGSSRRSASRSDAWPP